MTDACEQRGIVDLVTVEIKNRQNCAVSFRVEKLVDVPRSCEWTSFGFAIADYRRNDQIRIVEGSATRVRKYITEFPALVNRSGSFRCEMTADSAWKGEFLEEVKQPF